MSHQEGSDLDRDLVSGVPRDEEMEAEIKDALVWDRRIEASTIRVGVCSGAVTLSGYARTEEEKAIAGEIASRARGVTDVTNDLKVVGPEAC